MRISVAIALLAELTNLEIVRLDGTSLSDLLPLSELRELRIIYMSRTEVSDLSLLVELNLERIFIRKTRVNGSQLEAFRLVHPNCTVYR
ncbi:MAG: hypothetical protein ACKVHR_19285 [Pirellulales bacterium]|jgi:Leucine-rich repeat (LRR) protein